MGNHRLDWSLESRVRTVLTFCRSDMTSDVLRRVLAISEVALCSSTEMVLELFKKGQD